MIHHTEHYSVGILIPDDLFDGLGAGDEESLLNVVVDQLSFVSTQEKHVSKFLKSVISISRVCTDPDNPQSQRIRDIVCAMCRMTGGGEEILATVGFLPV